MFSKIMEKIEKIVAGILIIALSLLCISEMSRKSDDYIRARVVKLEGNGVSCTGEQVRARSGKDYILSAGHCMATAVKGVVTIITEDGKSIPRKVIDEDPNSDLMLIEGIEGLRGLDIAKTNPKHQSMRTYTHGKGYDTYKTLGVVVQDIFIQVPLSIPSPEEFVKCSLLPKFRIMMSWLGPTCFLSTTETVVTAFITGGSSGGPALDSRADVIGVASAISGDGFGYFVTLSDIQKFLSKY